MNKLNTKRIYQNDGKLWKITEILKLNRGDKTISDEEVAKITDKDGNSQIITIEDFKRYFFPADVQPGDVVYEYSMGCILRTYVAKDVKDERVSYRTIDGLKTSLTTTTKVYEDCRLSVITPTANSEHSEYVFSTFQIEKQLNNLGTLRKIRKVLADVNCVIDQIGANVSNISQNGLKDILERVEKCQSEFQKLLTNERKHF
jgi:hypothetical protein